MPLQMLNHIHAISGTLDFMNESNLLTKLIKPWEVTENPATTFAHDDKIEKQLIKTFANQQKTYLAFVFGAFKGTGKYNPAICKWEAQPTEDKTFTNFQPFIIAEHAKCNRHNKATASSISHSLANAATTKINDEELQAWAIAKVANAIQAAQFKQTDKMMEMFKTMMQAMQGNKSTTPVPAGALSTRRSQHQKCPHCGLL